MANLASISMGLETPFSCLETLDDAATGFCPHEGLPSEGHLSSHVELFVSSVPAAFVCLLATSIKPSTTFPLLHPQQLMTDPPEGWNNVDAEFSLQGQFSSLILY